MDLDQEQIPLLKNLKLPMLQNLSLADNFVTDSYIASWITPANMPQLITLDLTRNHLTDQGIDILVRHNFSKLSNVSLSKNRKLTPSYLLHLSKIKASQWTCLDLSENAVNQTSLRSFFQLKSFPNLQELKMQKILNARNIFQYLDWKSMKKLKLMDFHKTDLSKSIDFIISNKINFPSLNIWKCGGNWMKRDLMDLMLKNLNSFGPELQLFQALLENFRDKGGYINISALNYETVPKGVFIKSLYKMTVFRPWQGNKLQIIDIIHADKVNVFEMMGFFETMFHYTFFGDFLSSEDQYSQNGWINDDKMVKLIMRHLAERAVFTNIEVLKFYNPNDFYIFMKIWLEFQDQGITDGVQYAVDMIKFKMWGQDFQPNLDLPYLKKISYMSSIFFQDLYEFLYPYSKIRAPMLNSIIIEDEQPGKNNFLSKFYNLLLRNNPYIHSLSLQKNKLNCEELEKILENIYLPYLIRLSLKDNFLSSQCLSNVLADYPRIKHLDLMGNTDLTSFINDTLSDSDLLLQIFILSYIPLQDDQFAQLSIIDTQFLKDFRAESVEITQNGIKWLIGNSTEPIFPKIQKLQLSNNYYNEQSVSSLFSQRMNFLEEIFIYEFTDPNIFNEILLYPTKLNLNIIMHGHIKSFEPPIDKRALRHTQLLAVHSKDFDLEDFQILSQYDYPRLDQFVLQVTDIYDCQLLKCMLTISKNVENLIIMIKNTKKKGNGLDDKCLPSPPQQDVFFKHLAINIVQFLKQSSYIPRFYNYIYSNYISENDQLKFDQRLQTDNEMLRYLSRQIGENITSVDFSYNFLTDAFAQVLFQKPMDKVGTINLKKNNIELIRIDSLKGKSFSNLKILNLDQNDIRDSGIDVLIETDFPKLQELYLNSCDITGRGLIKLLQMNAPKLRVIEVKNTLISEWDLVYIADFVDLSNFPAGLKIETNIEVLQINSQRIQKLLMEKYGVLSIQFKYESRNLKEKNKAVLEF